MAETYDYIIVGAGSAGCAVAWQIANANCGTIAVLESGKSDQVPQVKVPFGLLYTMGSGRDWNFRSTPQANSAGRSYKIPRGKMLGGGSSINSMVWIRGRRDDFDGWGVANWAWSDVEAAFEAVEAELTPPPLPNPHPLASAFARTLGSDGHAAPTPEYESAGIFNVNMRNGRRWSAADAFLRPAQRTGRVNVLTGANVDHLEIHDARAFAVHLTDGRVLQARKEIVLSSGSIGSPEILLRSGIGPSSELKDAGIEVVHDLPGVGKNLHDHPAAGIHYMGRNTGYGLVLNQLPHWAVSPFNWLARRKGRMTSNFVEAGAFFKSKPDTEEKPDIQVHFIPYMIGWHGSAITSGSGYFADVCVCRPRSRGSLTITRDQDKISKRIDLGIFNDEHDLDTLANGWKRLRNIMETAPFTPKGEEAHPGEAVSTNAQIREHLKANAGTAYHPVGSVRMGDDAQAPLDKQLRVRGIEGLRVADASVMPQVTSANTNAPSMMIGYRAGQMIVEGTRT